MRYVSGLIDEYWQEAPIIPSAADRVVDLSWVPDDFATFCREYLTLSAGASGLGLTELNPFDFQEAIAHSVDTRTLTGVYKSRQQGGSEVAIAYVLWRMLGRGRKEKGFTCLIYSITQDDAKALGDRMINMLGAIEKPLPDWEIDSTLHRRFGGGYGDVRFLSPNRGRSRTGIDLIIIDEIDFIPGIESLLAAVKPTMAKSGGHFLYLTTPNGTGGEMFNLIESIDLDGFYEVTSRYTATPKAGHESWEFWDEFVDGDRAFFTVHWKANPFYDQAWADEYRHTNNIPKHVWDIEFEIMPNAGGSRVFMHEWIEDALRPMRSALFQCEAGGIDPNGGTIDNDMFALSMVYSHDEPNQLTLVPGYYSNQEGQTAQMGEVAEALDEHEPLRVVVESNGIGAPFYQRLQELYPLPEDAYESFNTTNSTKAAAIQTFSYFLEAGFIHIPADHPIREELPYMELKVDKRNKRTYEAKAGKKDDMIMATVLPIYALARDPSFGGLTLEQAREKPKPLPAKTGAHGKRVRRRLPLGEG